MTEQYLSNTSEGIPEQSEGKLERNHVSDARDVSLVAREGIYLNQELRIERLAEGYEQ